MLQNVLEGEELIRYFLPITAHYIELFFVHEMLSSILFFLCRKKTLMANNVIAIIGGIFLFITKATHSIYVLILGRLLVGVNAGRYCLLSIPIG